MPSAAPKASAESEVPSELLARSLESWKFSESLEGRSLLRLAILRDLLKHLHAEKSRRLASGKKSQAQQLRSWEARIEELRQAAQFDGELVELLSQTTPPRKKTRVLPEALAAAIGKEKLDRYDRLWEAALAAEGASLGWSVWKLEHWVEVGLAEEWNQRLSERLWPHAIVLFVESAPSGPNERAVPNASLDAPGVPLWKGLWTVLVHPKFKTPEEIALDYSRWPGAPEVPPQPHSWKLLHSPRRI